MPRVIQFEGRTVQVPDDFTDAEIAAVLAPQQSGAQSFDEAGFTPSPEVNLTELAAQKRARYIHSFGYGAQQAVRGAAEMFTLPLDLAAGMENLVFGGINKAIGKDIFPQATPASTLLERGVEASGIPVLQPESPGEKLGGAMSRYGTQALVAGGGAALAAPARATALAAGGAPKVGDAFVRPFFKDPARTFAGTAAGGAGSGAAINAAEENLPPEVAQHPLTQMGAALAGGVGGAGLLEAGSLAGRTATSVASKVGQVFTGAGENALKKVDPVTLKPYTSSELDTAASAFQGGASKPSQAARAIEENAAYYRENNLPVPTAGLISEDVGLQSAEAGMRSRNGVPFVERDIQLKNAATEKVGSLRNPEADQGAVLSRAGVARNEQLGPAEAQVRSAEEAARDAAVRRQAEGAPLAAIGNENAKATASQKLDKSIVEEGYIPARAEKNRQFETAPGRRDQLPTDEISSAVSDVRAQNNKLRPDSQLPEDLVSRLDKLAPKIESQQSSILDEFGRPVQREVNVGGPGTALGADLADTRKFIKTATEQARAKGNFDMADSLSRLGAAVNKTIEAAPGYAEANQNYKQFADTYRPSPNEPAAQFTRQIDRDPGRGTTPPSQTASRFLQSPEKAAALGRMVEAAASPQEGQAAVRNYLRSDFASAALNSDGTINARRAQAWISNNSDVLDQFPQVSREFGDIAARARTGEALSAETQTILRAAQDDLATTGRSVESGAIGTLLKNDPRDVAERIFSGRSYGAEKELDQIHAVIGQDKAAREGWKAAVSEVISDKVTGLTKTEQNGQFRVELGKLDKMFKDNEHLLAKVYTPEEMNTLRQAHKLLDPLKNATIKASGGSNTADKLSSWLRAIEVPIRTVKGALEGGSIMRKIRILASTLPSDKATIDRLVTQAYFDPDVAKFLLTRNIETTNAPGSSARIKALIAAGAGARASGPE